MNDAPRIPLGRAGDPHPFPATPVYGAYRLSASGRAEIEARLPLYDADEYIRQSDLDIFGARAQQCVVEALACYRSDLFLAAANMLGAASEAVWRELADALVARGRAGSRLMDALDEVNPGIAKTQAAVLDDLRRIEPFRETFGFPRAALDVLGGTATYWRESRNYGMHPRDEPDEHRFSQAAIALQLMSAAEYFARLAAIRRALDQLPGSDAVTAYP